MRGRGASGKTPVVGIAERKGEMRLAVTEDTTAKTLDKVITDTVKAWLGCYDRRIPYVEPCQTMGLQAQASEPRRQKLCYWRRSHQHY